MCWLGGGLKSRKSQRNINCREYNDLVQGQKSLLDLIKSKGVQIHTNLSTALQCTADILKNVSIHGTSPEEQVTYKLKWVIFRFSTNTRTRQRQHSPHNPTLTNKLPDVHFSRNCSNPEHGLKSDNFFCRRLREVYDSYGGQMRMVDFIDAYQCLTNRSLEISKLYNYFNSQARNGIVREPTNNGVEATKLTFEKFCAIMAELSTDGCGMCNIEGKCQLF